jgi:hypothetical protein
MSNISYRIIKDYQASTFIAISGGLVYLRSPNQKCLFYFRCSYKAETDEMWHITYKFE